MRTLVLVLACSLPSWATWTHIQGNFGNASSTTANVVLGVNPTTGNLVIVSIGCTGTPTAFTVADSASNSYTVTSHSPAVGSRTLVEAYLLSAPANANKTITASWTTSTFCVVYADEFHSTITPVTFDKETTGTGTGASSAYTGTTLTPANSGELVFSILGSDNYSGSPAPTAGGTLGVWTGASGGPQSGVCIPEYDLSISGATAVNYTVTTGSNNIALEMAFGATATTPTQPGAFLIGQ